MVAPPRTLAERLATVRQLRDLCFLVRFSGAAVRLETIARADLPIAGDAVSLGGMPGCRWIAVQTEEAADLVATRLARRLEREAEVSCLLVLNPAQRRLAVSVSLAPYPVLTIALEAPEPVAIRCLERLRGTEQEEALVVAARVTRALEGQSAGRRFFETFRRTLDRMRQALPSRIPSADRHALGLLDLTRILFLYFVQAKGWLDGRPRFLTDEVDRTLAGRGHLHADLLRPLFFGTLNQPGPRRGATARRFGAIPFLNGGLFEPHPLERRWRPLLPNDVLRDAFDLLFERFHFTVHEADGTAIAPDMLGRVFEGVMAPEERGATGTFYTPAALVDDVLTAAFEAHLSRRLGCSASEAARRLQEPDAETRAVLGSLRILDPAVGSGAFLLGAFQRLTSWHPPGAFRAGHAVLANNLFGVDLNPAAVRLAELRLWLALISADRAEDPAEVAPLPNLDSLVRAGDSLGTSAPQGHGAVSAQVAERVRAGRAALLVAVGPHKREALRELQRAEQQAAEELLAQRMATVQAKLRDLAAVRRSPTLFGEPRGLNHRERKALEDSRADRAFLHAGQRRLARDGVLPWFEYATQFADVFQAGGFDLVVGNPPWVRAEELPRVTRQALSGRFRWWMAGGTAGYRHLPDLAVAFLERAFELASPGGTVAMLVPAKLATAGYGRAARTALVRDHTLHRVASLSGDPRASFEATVYPLALVASKGASADPAHQVRLTLRDGEGHPERAQASLGAGPWVLESPSSTEALDAVRGGHPRLGDRLRASLGVKTGHNEAFLDPPAPIEPELLRWTVRGRDVRAFTATPRHRILWTHDAHGAPLATLPPMAAAWIGRHRAALRARTDWQGGAEWAVFRTAAAARPHRVVWADLARRLEAACLADSSETVIPLNSCYVLSLPNAQASSCLTAWLNCTWIRALAAVTADPAAGGCRRFRASVIESLPLPEAALTDAELARLAGEGAQGRLSQADLDDACNRHLRLEGIHRRALARLVPGSRAGRR